MYLSHVSSSFATPKKVSAEHYVCMRDVMPPTHHSRSGNSESFQLEPDASGYACTLVRIGATHWQFLAPTGQSHLELTDKVRKHIQHELQTALDSDLAQQRMGSQQPEAVAA